MTRDLRTLIYLLNLGTPRRMFENIGPGYAIGEHQSKRTRSGGEQQLKRAQSRGAAAGGGKRGARAAVEADAAIGPGAATEADASGEQQLKRTQSGRSSSSESCPAPDYAR